VGAGLVFGVGAGEWAGIGVGAGEGLELVPTLEWRLEMVLGLGQWLKSKLDWRLAFGGSVGVGVLECELELVRGLQLELAKIISSFIDVVIENSCNIK
jgi:hypothetical protein